MKYKLLEKVSLNSRANARWIASDGAFGYVLAYLPNKILGDVYTVKFTKTGSVYEIHESYLDTVNVNRKFITNKPKNLPETED